MIYNSAKVLSSVISIILSLMVLMIMIFQSYYLYHQIKFYSFWIFILLFIFTFSYIIVLFFIQHFILKRIEPIYKTINAIKIPKNELYERIEDKDIIQELNSEVMSWAKLKEREVAQLKYNDKVRKEFIGNIAHELKTPVFNIQGYILTLLDGAMEDEQLTQKYLKRCAKNVKRMVTIIQDVDTIARLESGIIHLNYTEFNLVDLILEDIELQEIKSEKYNITIDFDSVEYDDIMVVADRGKISEVINNLISNSLKYGKAGGRTEIRIEQRLHKIFVKIQDSGIGIAQEHLPRIFERFYRVDKSRSRERGGSGLGLAIVKHIIEAHHEHISVESELAKGSTFTFSLQLINF